MADTITAQEFRLIGDYIEKHCGIHLEKEKMYLVESRLAVLLVENGCNSFAELHRKASADTTNALRDKVIDAMTTNETLWFRDGGPFEILRGLIDGFAEEIGNGRRSRIRIWCCACSTGQEPYSVAMTVLESGRYGSGLKPEQVEIIATDISSTALFMAKMGRYDQLSISRGLKQEYRDRYFRSEGRVWSLADNVKKMVTFRKMNLQESFLGIGKCDIVMCRNVVIYFSEGFKRDIFGRLTDVLRPSGYLFVGSSESVSAYCGNYQMIKNSHVIYYQVKQDAR